MFENFSFDPQRSLSLDSNNTISTSASRSVSPCSESSPYLAATYSVTDLVADLDRHRLRQQSSIYSQPCDSYAALDDDAGWTIDSEAELPPVQLVRSAPVRNLSTCRRRALRQANARLLCSASHHRDISALVTKMIDQQEQCLLCPIPAKDTADRTVSSQQASSGPVSRSKDYRRPSDLRKTGALICKSVRMRKDTTRRQKSTEK